MDERLAYIALNMMENIGPVGVRALVQRLGRAAAIFEADTGVLAEVRGIGRTSAAEIVRQARNVHPEDEEGRAEALGARLITPVDDEYPRALLDIHDPPLALYVRGRLQSTDRRAVAVVGTRHPSSYGRATAEKLSWQLAKAGMTVVSGLALGIDTAAHQGALKAGGRTLAVIGSALDRLYPVDNAGLANDVAAQGAVISEFPLGRAPDKTTFPMRNRVVSGLSMGVVVVEAGGKSGALITARQAGEQGRSVFAVPGRIDMPGSRGPHGLIRDGARLVASAADVLEEFEFLVPRAAVETPAPARRMMTLSDEEERIWRLLADGEKDVDSLIRQSGLRAGQVNALLIGMEMKRLIRMRPGRIIEQII